MSTITLATQHDPALASSALCSPSRLRLLIGGATMAAAAYLPTAATGAAFEQGNTSTRSTNRKGTSTMSSFTREHASEVALVGESAGHRNLGDRQLRPSQQAFRALQSFHQQAAVGRHPGDLFERTDEVTTGQSTERGQLRQVRIAGQIVEESADHAALWRGVSIRPLRAAQAWMSAV